MIEIYLWFKRLNQIVIKLAYHLFKFKESSYFRAMPTICSRLVTKHLRLQYSSNLWCRENTCSLPAGCSTIHLHCKACARCSTSTNLRWAWTRMFWSELWVGISIHHNCRTQRRHGIWSRRKAMKDPGMLVCEHAPPESISRLWFVSL